MNRIIIGVTLLLIFVFQSCCTKNSHEFIINGEVKQARLEGQWVFLVPVDDSVKAVVGVDSFLIRDMKFRFVGSEEYVADIRIDWHMRYGTQNLLVVTEPGTINVVIDSTSVGGGTPQNELLQQWKDFAIYANRVIVEKNQVIARFKSEGDTISANCLRDSVKAYRQFYEEQCRSIAEKSPKGTIGRDFILSMYPKK
ncbi:MAG: DUF4369 domain-containing protein [Marinilabiliaceae bacterium]|nr:DUF4369 domain-containing protein [Marinilabiliaceae bacterium]